MVQVRDDYVLWLNSYLVCILLILLTFRVHCKRGHLPWHSAAFNILYVGRKEWRMAPPIYRGWTGMSARLAAEQLDEHYTLQCVSDSCAELCIRYPPFHFIILPSSF